MKFTLIDEAKNSEPSIRRMARTFVVRNSITSALGVPPSFPELEWTLLPESHRCTSRHIQECNWLQALEGGFDPAKINLDEILHHEHPIVITHPHNGRKALFISRLISMRIVGMAHAESEDILNELADVAEEPSNVYVHDWAVGDVVI